MEAQILQDYLGYKKGDVIYPNLKAPSIPLYTMDYNNKAMYKYISLQDFKILVDTKIIQLNKQQYFRLCQNLSRLEKRTKPYCGKSVALPLETKRTIAEQSIIWLKKPKELAKSLNIKQIEILNYKNTSEYKTLEKKWIFKTVKTHHNDLWEDTEESINIEYSL